MHYLIFSPLICLANLMSWGKTVTHFACIVQRLVSSRRQIMYDSVASWNTSTTPAWMQWSPYSFCRISLTSHKNGALGSSNSIDFWNFWISCRACVPGQNRLLLLGVFPAFGFIFSSLSTPICGVLPFKIMSHSGSAHVTRVWLTQRKDRDKTHKIL